MMYSLTFLGLAAIATAATNGTEPHHIDGAAITTATLTQTNIKTITSCAPEIVDCPAKTAPVVTTTIEVYTTVCPVSELPDYTVPVVPGAPISQIPDGQVQAPTATEAPPAVTTPEATTPEATVPEVTAAPIPGTGIPGTGIPVQPTTTAPGPEFTGAASANKVGGGLMAAAFVAALL